MVTGAVLIAANMQSEEKGFLPLRTLGSITVIERVVSTFLQAGINKIVLVTGEHAEEIEKQMNHMGIICLRNENYLCSDMLQSAKIGFSFLVEQCDRIGFCPVDIPMFTAETVKKAAGAKEVVISPSYKGKGGHPLFMDRDVVEKILQYEGEGGIPEAIRFYGYRKAWFEVADEGTLFDLAKTEVSKDLVNSHKKQMLHPQLKLSIGREQNFFGPGPVQLLELIENTGSVRSACQLMNISYSKGWKMIRLMEEQWEHKIVKRQQGGTTGGCSYLTEEGKDLISRYLNFQKEVKQEVDLKFEKYFANLK
ncbi:MAG: NTP transferase domain-containing protein [Acetivibrio sp.]